MSNIDFHNVQIMAQLERGGRRKNKQCCYDLASLSLCKYTFRVFVLLCHEEILLIKIKTLCQISKQITTHCGLIICFLNELKITSGRLT